MAIIQRQAPRSYQRAPLSSIALPDERPAPRSRITSRERPWSGPLLMCAIVSSALVLYVSGYQRMTAANYQRVQILRTMRSLQAARQVFGTEIIRRREKDSVEAWALANGMVPADGVPVIVGADAQKGR